MENNSRYTALAELLQLSQNEFDERDNFLIYFKDFDKLIREHAPFSGGNEVDRSIYEGILFFINLNFCAAENRGSGYPEEWLNRIGDQLLVEINEEAIFEIFDYCEEDIEFDQMVTLTTSSDESEYYFRAFRDKKNLITYEEVAERAKESLKKVIIQRYTMLSERIKKAVRKEKIGKINGCDAEVEDYL